MSILATCSDVIGQFNLTTGDGNVEVADVTGHWTGSQLNCDLRLGLLANKPLPEVKGQGLRDLRVTLSRSNVE